jgi:hypothetical protein
MTANRLWAIGLVLVCVAILALGWFIGVAPQFAAASASNSQKTNVEAENQTHAADLVQLKKQFSNVGELQQKLSVLRASVPSTIDNVGLLAALNDTAQKAGVSVTTITVSDPAIYVAAAAAASAAATPTPSGSASPSPSPSASSGTPAAGATATAVVSPAEGQVAVNPADSALVGGGNFITIPVSISFGGNEQSLLSFLTALQTSTRLFVVTAVTLTAGDSGGSGSVSGLVYVLSDPSAAK